MEDLIISVSGLRGVYGESLTDDVAARYAFGFARTAPEGAIVLSRDGRPSGAALAAAVASGLAAAGRRVIDAGIAATPTTGVLVRELEAGGGIQISASHNPARYNGLKLFSPQGSVLTAAEGERVRRSFREGDVPRQTGRDVAVETLTDATSRHFSLVLDLVDTERIHDRRLHVLLDCNHGAGALLAVPLLNAMGCRVSTLGAEPDGAFEHPPEPTAENLAGVLPAVRAAGADVGFCQDPDADRLAVIDQNGRYLGEECTLALCVDHVLREQRGAVVTNCATSRMTEDLARVYKVPYFRSAVGEANVVELMQAHDAVLGGEGNGGVIDPRVGFVRDSFVGMALILDAMAKRSATADALAAELPRYEIVKTRVGIDPSRVPAGLEALARHFADAECDRLDGLRLDWPDKWLLVRGSNTEPIVRVMAEATTLEEARRLCAEAQGVLERLV